MNIFLKTKMKTKTIKNKKIIIVIDIYKSNNAYVDFFFGGEKKIKILVL